VYTLGRDGTPQRIAALPADAGPNGVAIDPAGRTLYIADSFKSIIWSVPVSGGSVTPWLTDAALAPVPTEALPIGANGLRDQFRMGRRVGLFDAAASLSMRGWTTRS
jgi:hypothetical protein